MEAVQREGAGHAAKRLAAFGQICGSAEALQQGRLANENPPRLKTFDAKGRRLDVVEFHPAYHACMEISVKEGLHCSAWDHLASPGAKPVQGANVARSAGRYMATQMEAGHQCPITMTNASVPTLLLEPDLAKWWIPKILSRDYDKSFKPAGDKRGVTIGMGMTEKQGGTDVRANTTDGRSPCRQRRTGCGISHHRSQVVHVGADVRCLPGAGAGAGRTVVLPDAALPARRHRQRAALPAPQGQARQSLQCLLRGGVPRRARLADRRGRAAAFPAIIEMVTGTRLDCAVASAGLMRCALANAIHHCRHRTVFAKPLVDQPLMTQVLADLALDVEAATALSASAWRAASIAPPTSMRRPGAG